MRATVDRFLLRPYALAGQPLELAVGVLCALALVAVFIADISTPVQVAVSALGLLPLLAALWLLSRPWGAILSGVAVGQLLLSGFLGTLSLITVGSEATAYVVLAVVWRLFADSVSHLVVGSPRIARIASATGLTKRERQVARLAADGYTAREIGDQLHIGKRTVETHLANAYEKLGVRSKRELMHSQGAVATSQSLDG